MREADLDKDEVMNDFGLKVYKEMASITGRVLDPPQLVYGQKRQIQPTNGQWDMRREKFVEGVTIDQWGIIVFPRSFDERYMYMHYMYTLIVAYCLVCMHVH